MLNNEAFLRPPVTKRVQLKRWITPGDQMAFLPRERYNDQSLSQENHRFVSSYFSQMKEVQKMEEKAILVSVELIGRR